jgi:hypothetical protein
VDQGRASAAWLDLALGSLTAKPPNGERHGKILWRPTEVVSGKLSRATFTGLYFHPSFWSPERPMAKLARSNLTPESSIKGRLAGAAEIRRRSIEAYTHIRPRMLEWRASGMTQVSIADRLNGE